MKEKVFWTEGEMEKLVDQLETMCQNSPGESLIRLVNRAQESWPADRRRIFYTQTDPRLKKIKQVLIERLLKNREELRTLKLHVSGEHKAERVEQPTTAQLLDALPLSELGARWMQRVVGLLERIASGVRVGEGLTREMLSAVKSPTVREGIQRAKLPHYIVVGLLGDQKAKIIEEFGKRVRFHFFDSSKNLNESNLPDADAYFLMTKFINHSVQELIVDHAKLRKVPGGMTACIGAIQRELGTVAA